jgi:hypothetical protein
VRYLVLLAVLCGCGEFPARPPRNEWVATHGTPLRVFTDGEFNCSGILIDGWALTAGHCLRNVAVGTIQGSPVLVKRTPWENQDAILLFAPNLSGVGAVWGKSPVVGDHLTISGWGCSDGRRLRSTGGKLRYRDGTAVVVGSRVCHGDSGAPVFDDSHRLVGIAVVRYSDRAAGIELLGPPGT